MKRRLKNENLIDIIIVLNTLFLTHILLEQIITSRNVFQKVLLKINIVCIRVCEEHLWQTMRKFAYITSRELR